MELRLFGSVARGDDGDYSDIDVLVLLHTQDLASAKHPGVRALFNERFVKGAEWFEQAAAFIDGLDQTIEGILEGR